jgi:hypothetical protein
MDSQSLALGLQSVAAVGSDPDHHRYHHGQLQSLFALNFGLYLLYQKSAVSTAVSGWDCFCTWLERVAFWLELV